MGGHVCAVNSCKSKSSKSKISFFMFPKDQERARIWAMACGRDDLTDKVERLHRGYHICGGHFETKYFLNDLRNRLQPNAVPTIFPTLEGSTSSTLSDHEYAVFHTKSFVSDIKTECDETAGENEIVENKDDFWTFSETSALVEAYGHHIKSFAEDGHELPTWSRISTELSSKNIHRSPESCERKWESLVQKHNRGQTNYESDDVSNALVETAEQSSKRHKGDCECYERKIVAKQKRHRERMDLIKRKLEIEERKLAAFEKYLAHLSTGKE
ncbi:uncharacterized protein isoform X3 [Leptinotarsa decemlineata]|uniref:uncharacterized protein isoform X3 n=1 Tax=Leptinotarsa decemlineata TaxID=7539 RepID=UPI003D308697